MATWRNCAVFGLLVLKALLLVHVLNDCILEVVAQSSSERVWRTD